MPIFTRTRRDLPRPLPEDAPNVEPFPAEGGLWVEDDRVDGVVAEDIDAAEANRRAGKLSDAQMAGARAEAQLAQRAHLEREISVVQNEVDRLRRLQG